MLLNLRTAGIATCAAALILAAGCNNKTEQASTTDVNGRKSSAPSGEQAANSKMALVRFVNAVPGQSRDLYFGDTNAFPGVSFKTVTPYRELPSERQDFKLGANSTVRNSEGLTAGSHYTVVADIGKDGKERLNVINDNLSEPAGGKAKIRVINASPIEVDVAAPVAMAGHTAGDADRVRTPSGAHPNVDKWFGGVNENSSTSYKDVDPMTGTLSVLPSGHLKGKRAVAPAAMNVPVDLAAGKIYTLVVTSSGDKGGVDVIKVEDELVGARAAKM